MHRNITYRLLPGTRGKAAKLSQTAGACRFVWNHSLASARRRQARFLAQQRLMLSGAMPGGWGVAAMSEIARKQAQGIRPPVTFFSLGKQFTQLRQATPWLKELPFACVRHALKYQADAWQRAFRGESGLPKFKARRGDDGFTIPQDIRLRSCDGGCNSILQVPKIGRVILRRHGGNPYQGCKPVQAVVKRVLGRWYCTVCYAVPDAIPAHNGRAVGLDCNAGQVATSEGVIFRMPDLAKLEARKRRYQRMMCRRVMGSQRRALARYRCAKTQRRIAMIRADWQHHVSRELADGYGTVVIEALNTKHMTATAKGTAKRPGQQVKAKADLNRRILATGWAGLKVKLAYKAAELIEVEPAYTSQRCSACGHTAKENRRSQAKFECVACGHRGNADVNAALNILALGTGATGRRGAFALATPMNRQPGIPMGGAAALAAAST